MQCTSAPYAVVRSPSLRLSRSCILSKQIYLQIFFTIDHSSFFTPNLMAIFWREPSPQMGHRMQVGVWKIAIFDQHLASSRVVHGATVRCCKNECCRTVASWWHSSLVALSGGVFWSRETDDEAPRISEAGLWHAASTLRRKRQNNLIVRIGKSGAEVSNNTRLRSRYCTVEANYWQTQSMRGLSATAQLFVYIEVVSITKLLCTAFLLQKLYINIARQSCWPAFCSTLALSTNIGRRLWTTDSEPRTLFTTAKNTGGLLGLQQTWSDAKVE